MEIQKIKLSTLDLELKAHLPMNFDQLLPEFLKIYRSQPISQKDEIEV